MHRKPRNTRSLIRKAARTEFAQHGYSGARVARIAERAGVNKQLIFYYFRSKRGLFEAVMRGAVDEMAAVVTPEGGTESFRAAFGSIFASLADSPELCRMLFLERADPIREAALDRLVKILDELIAEGQGLGYFRDDLDPDFVARQAVSMLVAYFAMEESLFGAIDRRRDRWLKEVGALLAGWLTW